MRRLLFSSVLAVVALAALASSAFAASTPVITSVAPKQVAIGGTLVISGKNFKKGVKNNRVFFSRADGKTVRARPSKANSSRRIEVVVPQALGSFLNKLNGIAQPTRFRIQLLSGNFSKKLASSKSPMVYPAGSAPTTGGTPTTPGSTPAAPAPPPDCDADGNPDATDTDDDNDGLPDTLEAQIGTATCSKDTDGDGIEDGYEYWSAIDMNGNTVSFAGKKPYPNPLDATDAGLDFDQDGLTNAEEFQAWNLYGGRVLPTGPGQTFPYSAGNQTSPAADGAGGHDYDQNGKVTDEEKDADNDGLANWVELAKGSTHIAGQISFGLWTNPNGTGCTEVGLALHRFQDCGAGAIPNGNTFTDGHFGWNTSTDWLNPDSDGDGVNDSADDQDFDGVSNAAELSGVTNPVDPCDPNPESRTCMQHA